MYVLLVLRVRICVSAFGGWISVSSLCALLRGFVLMLTQTVLLVVCLCFILATQHLCVCQT